MIQRYFDKIAEILPEALNRMVGYGEEDLKAIERLYDVDLKGEFRYFMSRSGRCDGGAFKSFPLNFYSERVSVRSHLLCQLGVIAELQEHHCDAYLHKPFVLSQQDDDLYFFLQTGLDGPEYVYCFERSPCVVSNTGMTFAEYLFDLMNTYGMGGKMWRGELIVIS